MESIIYESDTINMIRQLDSIKEKEIIERIKNQFTNISIYATQQATRDNAKRNLLFFVVGINTPFKPGELINLKWSDLINNDMDLKQFINYNDFRLYLNLSIKNTIRGYFLYCKENNIKIEINKNIFSTRESEVARPETFEKMLNVITKALNIELNISIESLRKTFIYWQIKENKYDIMKFIQLQALINHDNRDSLRHTMTYAGFDITYDNVYINDVNL